MLSKMDCAQIRRLLRTLDWNWEKYFNSTRQRFFYFSCKAMPCYRLSDIAHNILYTIIIIYSKLLNELQFNWLFRYEIYELNMKTGKFLLLLL